MRDPDRRKRVRSIAAVSAAMIVVASATALAFTGSVILVDPQREVASAHVIDGWGHRQELAFIGFAFVVVPGIEGAIEIRCANGKVVRSGYVTPGAPTWQTI